MIDQSEQVIEISDCLELMRRVIKVRLGVGDLSSVFVSIYADANSKERVHVPRQTYCRTTWIVSYLS